MSAKVSIIVPVFNGEKSIGACLEGLLKQSLKEIEIVCVDDGSTDNSLLIIENYKKSDPRIKVISQNNKGLSGARNTGLENIKTPFVMFCDCDDNFTPDMCKKMLVAMEDNKVDVVACGTEVEYKAHFEMLESDSNYYRIKFTGKNYINDEIISKTDVSVCDKLFRMDLIKENKIKFPEGYNNEDYYFYNAYMSVAKTAFFINRKMYKYIRHEDSIMSDNFDRNAYSPDHLIVAQKLFAFYKKSGFLEKHLDLFWDQFSESFWFSYNHSARKYRVEIQKKAKEFINKNYEEYRPVSHEIRRKIKKIKQNDFLHKIWRRIKSIIMAAYKKMNVAYRQQELINDRIEKAEQTLYVLSDRLDNIILQGDHK